MTKLQTARVKIREVERFVLRILSETEESDLVRVHHARTMLRLAVGLRRKLDSWR